MGWRQAAAAEAAGAVAAGWAGCKARSKVTCVVGQQGHTGCSCFCCRVQAWLAVAGASLWAAACGKPADLGGGGFGGLGGGGLSRLGGGRDEGAGGGGPAQMIQ